MMVTYHVVYDIDLLGAPFGPDPFTGPWGALPEATASLFLLVVGVSLGISDARSRERGTPRAARWRHHATRGVRVLAAAMLVTVATYAVLPDQYVRFGILHSIAAATLLAVPLLRLGAWNLLTGAAILAVGIAIRDIRSDIPGAFVVGAPPDEFTTVDYWPVFPWMGVVLIGVALASIVYPNGRRAPWALRMEEIGSGRWSEIVRVFAAPGRRSLVVYLVHQPILIVIVALWLLAAGVNVSWTR